ncbi:NUMOD4 domain-containing protein [Peribacillus frigoritolerans]|uniref:NUMOD4 domain-containing protein n=1 Tax=Peribacillus frigoritolerans TaxID=450367 RepID=UPI003639E9C9
METYQNLDIADISGEQWSQFHESKRKYLFVSNLGRIKSKDKKTGIEMIRKQRLKKQNKKKDKSYHERLYFHINDTDISGVSRIVATAFIANPNNLPVVLHLDNNPKNNTVDNLRWGTQLDNIQQAYEDGLMELIEGIPAVILNRKAEMVGQFKNIKDAHSFINATVSGFNKAKFVKGFVVMKIQRFNL